MTAYDGGSITVSCLEYQTTQAEIAHLRAVNAELIFALQNLLDAVNDKQVTVGDCNQATAALANSKD